MLPPRSFIRSRTAANSAAADAPMVSTGRLHTSAARLSSIRSARRESAHMTLESGLKKRIMTSLLRNPVRRRAAPPVDLRPKAVFGNRESPAPVSCRMDGNAGAETRRLSFRIAAPASFEIAVAKIHIAGPVVERQIMDAFAHMIPDVPDMERLYAIIPM